MEFSENFWKKSDPRNQTLTIFLDCATEFRTIVFIMSLDNSQSCKDVTLNTILITVTVCNCK